MQTMERQSVAPVHPKSRRPAPWPVEFYRSAVGKKWVMALTGIMLMGFVFVHMFGNLKLYLGAEDINHYGEWLRDLLVPFFPRTVTLWLLRIGLIGRLRVPHPRRLRPDPHEPRGTGERGLRLQARLPGRQRRQPLDALHGRGHPALPDLPPRRPDLGHGQPRLRAGRRVPQPGRQLRAPAVSAIYIVANLALGLHLFHGGWSMFQSLGLNNPRCNSWRRGFAVGFAAVVTVGNLSFPIAALTGIISADDNSDCRVSGDVIETCELYVEGEQ